MFWEIFVNLCVSKKESPNGVASKLGFSSGTVTWWKKGRQPRDTAIAKIADYFSVSPDYLLGKTSEKEKPLMDEEPIPEGRERVTICGRNGEVEYADFTPEQVKLIRSMIAAQKKENK